MISFEFDKYHHEVLKNYVKDPDNDFYRDNRESLIRAVAMAIGDLLAQQEGSAYQALAERLDQRCPLPVKFLIDGSDKMRETDLLFMEAGVIDGQQNVWLAQMSANRMYRIIQVPAMELYAAAVHSEFHVDNLGIYVVVKLANEHVWERALKLWFTTATPRVMN